MKKIPSNFPMFKDKFLKKNEQKMTDQFELQ